jgi:hypothetical protein
VTSVVFILGMLAFTLLVPGGWVGVVAQVVAAGIPAWTIGDSLQR